MFGFVEWLGSFMPLKLKCINIGDLRLSPWQSEESFYTLLIQNAYVLTLRN